MLGRYINERMKRGQVWGIGKRRFKGDWSKRVFGSLTG